VPTPPPLTHRGGWAQLIVIAACVMATACATGGGVPRPRPFPGAALPPDSGAPPNPTAEQPPPAIPAGTDPPAVVTALTYRGVPYRDGGSDPSGFDCSGFVQWVFARVGVALPREVRDQYRIGTTVERNEIRTGDLVFFQTVAHGASHVGIALDGETFIHAPSARGVVRVERYTSEYWKQRYVGARRIEQPLPVSGERHRASD